MFGPASNASVFFSEFIPSANVLYPGAGAGPNGSTQSCYFEDKLPFHPIWQEANSVGNAKASLSFMCAIAKCIVCPRADIAKAYYF